MERITTWLVQDKVIFTCVRGEFQVEDFPEYDQDVIELFEQLPYEQVHVLVDISRMTTMPNVVEMTQLKFINHPKMGFFVTQGQNRLIQFVSQTVSKLLSINYQLVNNLDDGLAFLTQIEPSLPSVIEMQNDIQAIHNDFVEAR